MTCIRHFPRSHSLTKAPSFFLLSPTNLLSPPTTSAAAVTTIATSSLPTAAFLLRGTRPTAPSADANPAACFADALRASAATPGAAPLTDVGLYHSKTVKLGLLAFGHVGNPLLNLYVKSGLSLDSARRLFDEIPEKNVVTWTTLIVGCSRRGCYAEGLALFHEMMNYSDIWPNHFTLTSVFRCCGGLEEIEMGREIHGWILRNGAQADVVLGNSIVDFYAKCGEFNYARRVFDRIPVKDVESWNVMINACLRACDPHGSVEIFKRCPFPDVVSWNTIISGLIQVSSETIALEFLQQMVVTGPKFNMLTFAISLSLAGKLVSLQLGRQFHCKALRVGLADHVYIRNSLIDMYGKCGKIGYASHIFNTMPCLSNELQDSLPCSGWPTEETISWSSIISGYVQNGGIAEAFYLFHRMLKERIVIDQFVLTSITAACSEAGVLEQGRQIHALIEKLGHGFDVFLSSAISDMYAKCGSLVDAHTIFKRAQIKNVVLWTSMIGSFAMYGHGKEAIELFEMMLKENIRPNEVSFVSVLCACSHAGMVKEGYEYFRSMKEDHRLAPKAEHFTCMVDLLGRASLLNEAKDFIEKNDICHLRSVWNTLLSACRKYNNTEMAEWISKLLVKLEPSDANAYISLSNIYSQKRQWREASRFRNLMLEKGIVKQPGQSWIQLKSKVHVFGAGDQSHPQIDEVCSYLEKLIVKLREMGYNKETSFILHDVEEEEKETSLSFHSEMLAIAYGLISSPSGAPIRVMKNLRVCFDCHTAFKYISHMTEREIILRDAYRFHRFKCGACSCGDFW